MTDARNAYPRLCWGCLGIIEDCTHDRALLTYGGYCTDCFMSADGEKSGLREALCGMTERMNNVFERENLLQGIRLWDAQDADKKEEHMSEHETTSELLHASGIPQADEPSNRGIAGHFFIGEIPEPRPPSPSELVHPPYYPWASEQQLRHFVERCVREALDDLAVEMRTHAALRPSRLAGGIDEQTTAPTERRE